MCHVISSVYCMIFCGTKRSDTDKCSSSLDSFKSLAVFQGNVRTPDRSDLLSKQVQRARTLLVHVINKIFFMYAQILKGHLRFVVPKYSHQSHSKPSCEPFSSVSFHVLGHRSYTKHDAVLFTRMGLTPNKPI